MPTVTPSAIKKPVCIVRARPPWLTLGLLVFATLVAYHNSFEGPFVFDDLPAIRDNPTIRRLSTALVPPSAQGNTVGGRPLLNLSFALNYAAGGLSVASYHAGNLAIHLGAGLLLFGIVRRLAAASGVTRLRMDATVFAASVALIWLVHPLQTESVTYIVQRAESLAGFFVLLALYGFVRAAEMPLTNGFRRAAPEAAGERSLVDHPRTSGRRWLALSAAACIAGVATKEIVAVAPLLVLLCDRAFFSGSFGAALRARRWFYVTLAFSWVSAAALIIAAGGRGGSAGFATPISAWTYALTQCQAIVHYLRLTVWPSPLVFDYGSPVVTTLVAAAPYAMVVIALFAGALVAAWRWPRVAVPALAFFLLLGPSSSFVPVATQTLAEHRIYVPLAALIVLVASAIHRLAGRPALAVLAVCALPLTFVTARRNLDYRNAEALWSDTVTKRPDNPRAHNNLGLVLAESGRIDEAIAHFEAALRLFPRNPDALNNLALVLVRAGRLPEAVVRFEAALALAPDSADAHLNLADALVRLGRSFDAIAHYERGEQLRPPDAEVLTNHGAALLQLERPAAALRPLEAALALAPDHARAHYNLANALVSLQRIPEAIEHYRAAVRSAPGYVVAQANLGNALLVAGRPDEAAEAFEAAMRLRPGDARLRAAAEQARARASRPRD
ncbi:MAG TPA: tetratricopeptide repeat protein [Opitutaceae bacterium]